MACGCNLDTALTREEKLQKIRASTTRLRVEALDWLGNRDFSGAAAPVASHTLVAHVGENSPPACFLPQSKIAPSLFESL